MYTRVGITGSPTRIEIEKGSESVSRLILNCTAILSYKVFPLSEFNHM